MDRERSKPVADDTIFRIYSMTKTDYVGGINMLFEEGRFQLNDPYIGFARLARAAGLGAGRG